MGGDKSNDVSMSDQFEVLTLWGQLSPIQPGKFQHNFIEFPRLRRAASSIRFYLYACVHPHSAARPAAQMERVQ